ncbi:response regulator transcription factor [Anoxynatronum buryatiense]|uniref:Stage 0 sporulation protein A homolog n=1 Tax=Anoxynatronum buryatiense TaxID=489973 RepID=A0AA45WY15_9CLOT|nr:response regulator [Anoxynatronum buryatiense]SMP65286.1 two-component system, response regulator YesN [Anoxynatronum buryatiense]
MLKILIVDDEAIIRKGLENMVKQWCRFRVIGVADDGETALQWLHKTASLPDLIITDIYMQHMDGLKLIQQVNTLYPEIKCAILSGHEDFHLAQKAIELKVCQYITKPVVSQFLFDSLEKILTEISPNPISGNALYPKDVVEITIQYIRNYYQNPALSLQELADHASVHPNYLTQLFKRRMGIPCMQFLTQVRMEKAKELLLQSNLKVSTVARHVGYENPLYFSSYFKKWVGVNPSKYREA